VDGAGGDQEEPVGADHGAPAQPPEEREAALEILDVVAGLGHGEEARSERSTARGFRASDALAW
jgi:hypothetical protein